MQVLEEKHEKQIPAPPFKGLLVGTSVVLAVDERDKLKITMNLLTGRCLLSVVN